MSRFQISTEEYEAIKSAEKGSKDKRTSKRLRMLMLRYEGYKVEEIAKMYGTRKSAVGAGRKPAHLYPAIIYASIGMPMERLNQ